MDWSDIDWSAVAAKYSNYNINDLWMARQIIMDTRYAIAAMLALQIYEWIDRCVPGFLMARTKQQAHNIVELALRKRSSWCVLLLPFRSIFILIRILSAQIHRAKWTLIKLMYLLCRYYPFAVWILVIWAYVGNHDAQTCARVAHGVHATLAPCVGFFSCPEFETTKKLTVRLR